MTAFPVREELPLGNLDGDILASVTVVLLPATLLLMLSALGGLGFLGLARVSERQARRLG